MSINSSRQCHHKYRIYSRDHCRTPRPGRLYVPPIFVLCPGNIKRRQNVRHVEEKRLFSKVLPRTYASAKPEGKLEGINLRRIPEVPCGVEFERVWVHFGIVSDSPSFVIIFENFVDM